MHDGCAAANAEPIGVEPTGATRAPAFERRFEAGLEAPDALRATICDR